MISSSSQVPTEVEAEVAPAADLHRVADADVDAAGADAADILR